MPCGKSYGAFSLISRLLGLTEVKILFGFAWRNWIDPTPDWKYLRISLREIKACIKKEENSKNGRLGQDDLYIALGSPIKGLVNGRSDCKRLDFFNPSKPY